MSDKLILYVHGLGGSHLESEQYKKICPDFDIIGVNYDSYLPWLASEQIKNFYDNLRGQYKFIYVLANSIGAYFVMLSLKDCPLVKALFISPILDMENIILNMMAHAGITENFLREKGEFITDSGEILSWKYLSFVRENPIKWDIMTEILYAENDNITSRNIINNFVSNHNAKLTIMENGEHYFHTEEQINFLNQWLRKAVNS